MNKIKGLWMAGGLILALALSLLVAGQAAAAGQGYGSSGTMIIRVYGAFDKEPTARIEPDLLWVGRGSTVIWANMSQADIKISFPKGEECKKATAAMINWGLGAEGCLITQHNIPPGGTSSALFKDIGRYEYEIEYVDKNMKEKGTIEVRTEPGIIY
jgi:hypothetical protein